MDSVTNLQSINFGNMKLLNRIALNMSGILFAVMSVWAVFFYFAIITEVNDETDDSLEDFSELIITRTLAGMDVSRVSNGTNNQYYIKEVSAAYVQAKQHMRYADSTMYIEEKNEFEPARVLKTFFKDKSQQYYELLVITPTIEKNDLKQAILEWLAILWVSLLAVVILVNLGMFKRNMRPLYILLRWLDHYRVGGHNETLQNDTSIIEFRKLNEAALRNARRTEELFEQQKQFIGNASHEIQTPLAICRNRLELLLESESLTDFQAEEIDKVLNTLGNISKLNKSLLLLSKIENKQFRDTASIVVNDLVRTLINDLRDIYEYLNLTITIEEHATLVVCMNKELAFVLITNLLKNAFVHNRKEGSITISIDSSELTIMNTGSAEALNPHHIFERFHHTRKKEGSSGLGLAISDSICKLYGFECIYEFDKKGLHCFSLKNLN